jgi:serine/threonine protein kinase/tetratricopeptide (TPR) repeat protein
MRLSPGDTLGHYALIAPLGAGGMGEVYRARDSRLERDVAIKVLPARLAHDRDVRIRFEREAKAVAALNHPNILAIHDFGDHEGIVFAVTELLEGETLRARVSRSPLPWRHAVDIAIAVAEGLSAAHAKGIVHRDLKPENVFLTSEGRVKILDFGLARRLTLEDMDAQTAIAITAPGVVMGTMAYISPEQARGIPTSPTSDIFSLGCVVFEMLMGRRPFDRATAADTMAAILTDAAPHVHVSDPQAPAELGRIVAHCLEKQPADRCQSARDLAFNLRGLESRPVAVSGGGSPDAIDSLAVMPFINASGNPDTEYLSDGIAETLINSLSQMPRLRVVPRSKAFRYKGQDIDHRKVGRQLKVRALLTGKVLLRGDTLNIQAELVDVQSDAQLWGARFNRTMTDIFTVEEEIATQISEKLRLELSGGDRERLLKRHTENTAAYHQYLKGRYHWNKRTAEGLRAAIEYFRQAVDLDPGYATAYAGLADGHFVLAFFAPNPAKGFAAKAKAAALKALEIDPGMGEALSTLAIVRCTLDWDWREGERSVRRALELKPRYAWAHDQYAMMLSAMARHEEAVREVTRAVELEPALPVFRTHVAWMLIRARMYDEAIVECRKAIELDPNFPITYYWLGLVCGLVGNHDEAIPALETAHARVGSTFVTLELARAYASARRQADCERVLAEMHQAFDRDYAEPHGFATVYAALGRADEAFHWLERAALARTGFFATWVNGDPRLDPLRNDPRMTDLLRRMGLVPAS